MVVAWWRDGALTLCDNKNQPTVQRTLQLQKSTGLIGLFFGSFRNRSTKHFIKYLNKFYSYVKEQKSNFEILYVPLDEDEPDCEFFVNAVMGDWLVVPWSNQGLRRNARNMYNVLDQPWLVIVKNDKKGNMVTFEGKSDLLDLGYFCLKEWEEMERTMVFSVDEPPPEEVPLPVTPPPETETEGDKDKDKEPSSTPPKRASDLKPTIKVSLKPASVRQSRASIKPSKEVKGHY